MWSIHNNVGYMAIIFFMVLNEVRIVIIIKVDGLMGSLNGIYG